MSNSEASQTDGYSTDWQIQDTFILLAFCITVINQFREEVNSIQEKTGAVQCLKVHMQEIIRMKHVLLEVLPRILPSDTKEREQNLGKYAVQDLK